MLSLFLTRLRKLRAGWRISMRSLLLPLLMLVAQQGQLLHELAHLGEPVTHREGGKKLAPSSCEVCLAFGKVDGAAPAAEPRLPLLDEIAFAAVVGPLVAWGGTAPLVPGNRDPPAFL